MPWPPPPWRRGAPPPHSPPPQTPPRGCPPCLQVTGPGPRLLSNGRPSAGPRSPGSWRESVRRCPPAGEEAKEWPVGSRRGCPGSSAAPRPAPPAPAQSPRHRPRPDAGSDPASARAPPSPRLRDHGAPRWPLAQVLPGWPRASALHLPVAIRGAARCNAIACSPPAVGSARSSPSCSQKTSRPAGASACAGSLSRYGATPSCGHSSGSQPGKSRSGPRRRQRPSLHRRLHRGPPGPPTSQRFGVRFHAS
mmetsp:Transcript_118004/g.252023  ORF Transcript_118004/g.252023 Transcript_118004/m.252023 type:complete len:250 (+) Transcript_118004:359-1108(+)